MTIIAAIDQIIASTTEALPKTIGTTAKTAPKQEPLLARLESGITSLDKQEAVTDSAGPLELEVARLLAVAACTIAASDWARAQLFPVGKKGSELLQTAAFQSVDLWGRGQALYALIAELAGALEQAKKGGMSVSSVRCRLSTLPLLSGELLADIARLSAGNPKGFDLLPVLKPLQAEVARLQAAMRPILNGFVEDLPA